MRLRTLSLAGVGSFADSLEVDFEGLTQAGLFLIEGPTGSGKSTILDAIVFALYGSVAGSTSDPGRLNSHLSTESPLVELTFEVAEHTYLVRRSPGHRRRKRRGTGTTEVPATATLLLLGPDGPEELANRASDVADHVQQIVGLTKQQFASTVVLAQGEFATFLDAGTAERAQILERVFGTEFYKQVEDQLHVMRQAARKRRAAAADRLNEAIHECAGVLAVQFADDDPVADIDAALEQLRGEVAQANASARGAGKGLAAAREALLTGEKLVADQDRKLTALRKQAELAESQVEVQVLRGRISAHERATPVGPAIAAWRAAVADAQSAQDEEHAALRVLEDLGETPRPDARRLREVSEQLADLRRPAELEQGLESRRAALERTLSAAGAAQTDLVCAQGNQREIDNQTDVTNERLQALPDVADRISELAAAAAQLAARQSLWADIALRNTEWGLATDRAQQAVALALSAEESAQTAEHSRSRDQAAALALTLVAGQPCMVCGSVEHPDPATPTGPLPAGDIAQLRHVAQERRAEADEARSAADELAGILHHLESQCAGRDRAQDLAALETCTSEIADLQRQKDERASLQQQMAEMVSLRMSAAEVVARATLTQQRLADEARVAQGALRIDEHVVVQARAEHRTVAARIGVLSAARDALTAAADAENHARQCSDAQSRAKLVLEQTLASVGFAEVAAAEDAILDDAQYRSMRTTVEQWEAQSAQTAATLRELDEVDLEVSIDIDAHRTALDAATVLSREADARVSRLSDRLDRGIPVRQTVHHRIAELEAVREQTEEAIRMADYATAARNEVTHKIRLSSFVLMRRFEDVVSAANDRLDAISEGRYQLVVETHGLDARSQAGLDLRVYDGRSDSHRSTKSLSGGERFYVSLALALGLADVVRGESGGVELGTLFIDEGFGSLDAEVLDEVMDMLEQVRVGEDRVIGLISHVEVLKQRIDPRISVRRDPARPGVSTAQVHL